MAMEEEMIPPREPEMPDIQAASEETTASERELRPRKKTHEDHHVNRKYRVFSNHSSYGDSPHTHTSF